LTRDRGGLPALARLARKGKKRRENKGLRFDRFSTVPHLNSGKGEGERGRRGGGGATLHSFPSSPHYRREKKKKKKEGGGEKKEAGSTESRIRSWTRPRPPRKRKKEEKKEKGRGPWCSVPCQKKKKEKERRKRERGEEVRARPPVACGGRALYIRAGERGKKRRKKGG